MPGSCSFIRARQPSQTLSYSHLLQGDPCSFLAKNLFSKIDRKDMGAEGTDPSVGAETDRRQQPGIEAIETFERRGQPGSAQRSPASPQTLHKDARR